MLLKRKSILVITVSSIVIVIVLIATLLSFFIYIKLTEDNNRKIYKTDLCSINAELYSKYINIGPVSVRVGDEGRFTGKPIVQGHIKNYSKKKIVSIKLKLSIIDKDGIVIYMDSFYPLQPNIYISIDPILTGHYLAAGDSISFTHIIRDCPSDLLTYLGQKNRLIKEKNIKSFSLDYKIEEVFVE